MSKLGEIISKFKEKLGDKLADQQWFQELKAKWEELDAQSRMYLRTALMFFGVVGALVLVASFYWSVRSQRNDLAEKEELLALIQTTMTELRGLQDSTQSAQPGESWKPYLESTAAQVGIPSDGLQIGDEKKGASTDTSAETLVDVTLKKVNVRQLVRYAHQLENGARPMKIRNLIVDTKNDPSGYLEAVFSVSGFELK